MHEDRSRPSGRRASSRLLWILGLAAGVAIGAAAAFGLAGTTEPPRAGAASTLKIG